MNLLAHAYLGFGQAELVVGQIAGDFVKGRIDSGLPELIRQGIRMHRQLDRWTDQNRIFRRSCSRIPKTRRRVAGIMIDLLYDHSLARHWSYYSDEELHKYAQFVYTELHRFHPSLPSGMQVFIHRIPEIGLLETYQDWAGIERAVRYIAKRLSRADLVDGILPEMAEIVPEIDKDFVEFFPQAIEKSLQLAPALHDFSTEAEPKIQR